MKKLNDFDKTIYVCGFMASGKSTFGKALAKELGSDFIDLDKVIEEKAGQSIRQIFRENGESYFRKIEFECLGDLLRGFKGGVVALGGGALLNQEVVDNLKKDGLLVFVDTPMEVILERVHKSKERPILFDDNGKIKSKETLFRELKTLYLKREKLYKQAQVTIKTPLYTSVQEMAEAAIDKITGHV